MSQDSNKVVDLASRQRESREQLLERLYAEHGVPLRNFLWARTGREDELDDLVQEVFLRLARQEDLHTVIQPDSGSTRSYLFTAANNLVLDIHRRQTLDRNYRQGQEETTQGSIQEVTPERILEGIEDISLVRNAIMKLPPKCRQAFLLSRYENLSYRQIADNMNLSVKQIEKYISQALDSIRQTLRRAAR